MNEGWSVCKLVELAHVRISSVDKKLDKGETPILLCNYVDVYENDYVTRAIDFMVASANDSEIERFSIHAGDVVLTKDSETPDDIGVPAVVIEDIEGLVCGYHLALIRPRNSQIDSIYLAKQLQSAPVVRHFRINATGSTRFGLSIGVIENVEIPVASKPEQLQIRDVLFALDVAIERQALLVSKEERLRVGLMQDLLTMGVDEHGRLRSEKTHEFRDSPLGRIPLDWRVATVGEMLELRTERGVPGLPVMSVVMNEGLITRTSFDRRVESALSPEGHALVRQGDIAYNMMRMWQGVLGRAAFDCLVSPAYVVLKPNEFVDSRFVEWLFRDQRSIRKFRRSSRGVADDRLRLYPDNLFSIEFAFPQSVDEQREIANRLDATKTTIRTRKARLVKLRRLRQGLMDDLLRGKRQVSRLLPDPEIAAT